MAPILAAAFCLHMGINLTMQFPVFQYVMMVNLLIFLDPHDLQKWLGPASAKRDRAVDAIAKRAA